ncbi:DEAD/DEAH box helicase, partial [uncultured Fusobacterium sp.]|uniref:DEAD/DEAH box helicase n=1 Tax=uncultured Fusobacterium sp. TaxID=159267 RepID=UPI0025D550E3
MLSEYRGRIPFYLKNLKENIVYLCSSNKNIEDYYNTLADFYDGKILKIESSSDRDEIEKINYDLLELLKSKKKYVILISLEGFLRDYYLEGEKIVFEKNREISLKKVQENLLENSYEKVYMVEKRMQYSLRGDILDIFPKNGDYPVRVEFFGDNVERINYFDIETQKSIESLNKIDMYMNNNKNLEIPFHKLINLSQNNIIFENREVLQYKLEEIILRNRDNEEKFRERFSQLDIIGEELTLKRFSEDEIKRFENYENVKEISGKERILIISEESKRYQEIFNGYSIEFQHYPHYEGFRDKDTLVLTDRELKGIKVKRETKEKVKLRYKDVSQIRENDYIIHENYGVGIYLGIETIDGKDYLKIKYADEDKLFVPVEGINKIEKYISTDGVVPEIYQLGRWGFKKKREKLREDMLVFAKEIIEIQARRAYEKGYKFSYDTVWQEEFEESFPYKETESQLKAIEDVKRDMESDRVMDRVICGDVGYGKTEIAIRAAFKASVDGKQVALMVPTTVLAQQHFERFSERFKNYPITIELLSRLKSGKEQKEVLNKIQAGTIDIVIGTHRILSSDVKFKDLGLVIIDEEQKFGVKAKEQLKKIKNRIDMITLTATPIPRTLNLSLLGIRDLSVIDTPPEGRKPIETIFIEKDNKKLKDIIMEEIAREGQVFYIFNSIKNIAKKTDELRKILPNYLKLDFIHGQMTPKEIKNKIKEFENGDVDILVSTTIIENGIDIENANTMIIEGADR